MRWNNKKEEGLNNLIKIDDLFKNIKIDLQQLQSEENFYKDKKIYNNK